MNQTKEPSSATQQAVHEDPLYQKAFFASLNQEFLHGGELALLFSFLLFILITNSPIIFPILLRRRPEYPILTDQSSLANIFSVMVSKGCLSSTFLQEEKLNDNIIMYINNFLILLNFNIIMSGSDQN